MQRTSRRRAREPTSMAQDRELGAIPHRGRPIRRSVRSRRLLVSGLVLAGVLIGACATPGGSAAVPPPGSAPPRVASYLDVTGALPPDPGALVGTSSPADVVLAFVLAGADGCAPSWGGTLALDDPAVVAVVEGLKQRGVRLTLASGGALGSYLETACTDAGQLAAAYGQALDAVGTNRLDVDIEGDVAEGTVAEALAELQRSRDTDVTLTVQVEDQRSGITPEGLAMIRAARDAGVSARVNLMAMNFPPDGPWAPAVIEALDVAQGQVRALDPGASPDEVARGFGATVMIGRNDLGMTTTLADASAIRDYAVARGLGLLGLWSAGRDNGGCPGAPQARSDCSGVEQAPHAYTETLGGFRA